MVKGHPCFGWRDIYPTVPGDCSDLKVASIETWMFSFLLIIQYNLVLCLTKFVDTLLQPISKSQKSYLKRRIWKTEHFLFQWTLWVLTQIYSKTRVYWNCLSQSIWKFLQRQPIPTHRLILKENFFHFNGKHYLQNHGTAVGTKTAVLIPLPTFSWHILKQQL